MRIPRRGAAQASLARRPGGRSDHRRSENHYPHFDDPPMNPSYTAVAIASTGRQGHVRSDDGVLDLDLTVPEAIGGPGGDGTNPEQLFAAGYAACFGSAVRSVGSRMEMNVREVRIEAKVTLGAGEDGRFGLSVELVGHFPDLSEQHGRGLMEEAHEICPYSQAIRGNIEVALTVGSSRGW